MPTDRFSAGQSDERRRMSEENRALVRREQEEVFDEGRLELADEPLASDYTVHDSAVAEPVRGIAGFERLRTSYYDASSDARATIDDMIADGDKVVTRRSGRP
jgi:predicted SnoaL-like aldol condensation-catalyzing enzyme